MSFWSMSPTSLDKSLFFTAFVMNTEFQIKFNKTSVVYIATLSNLNGNRVGVSLERDPIGP